MSTDIIFSILYRFFYVLLHQRSNEENEMDFLFWIQNNHCINMLYKRFVFTVFGIRPFVTTLFFVRFGFSFWILVFLFCHFDEETYETLTFISFSYRIDSPRRISYPNYLTDAWFYCFLFWFSRICQKLRIRTHIHSMIIQTYDSRLWTSEYFITIF